MATPPGAFAHTLRLWVTALLVALTFAGCGGGSSTAPPGPDAAIKALTPANITPQDGIWWNPAESGRGYTLELQGNQLILTLYMYETGGVSVWYSGLLTQQPDGAFTGAILRYSGGQTLLGAYKAPTGNTTPANVSLAFSSATSGALTIQPTSGAAQTVAIQKFSFGTGGTAAGFQNGVWWNSGQSGRGFYVEAQGGQLSIGTYLYDASGQPVWYTAVAPLASDGMSGSGQLLQFANGQTLTGAYKPPAQSASHGTVTFAASSGNTAQLTLPDGSKVALQRFVFGGTTPTGRDLASLPSLDLTPMLTAAGSWVPTSTTSSSLIPFWGNIRTGSNQLEGVAMAGWAYSGFSNTATSVTTVRAVLLQQQADGRLLEASTAVLGNPDTNGAGSVLTADFNGDGREDLVFPAHNESPFLWQASTAFMSRADGGFNRIVLPDAVMNHDSRVVQLGGQTRIIARSFGGSGQNGQGAGFNVVYTWNGSNFTVDEGIGDPGGMSVVAGKFGPDSQDWVAIGDSSFGATPPTSWSPTNPMLNYIFRYDGTKLVTPGILLPKPYFNDKAEYAGFSSQWDPHSKTHTSRLYTTDLNQDGRPDIIAGQEIWSGAGGLQRSALQLLVNQGNTVFHDQTDVLAPEYDKQSRHIDYTLRLVDLDGSGIDSIVMVNTFGFTVTLTQPSGNFLLVNDGTGRLYAAMGNAQFSGMAPRIIDYANANVGGNRSTGQAVPAFMPYRTPNGLINYVAMVSTVLKAAPFPFAGYYFVNVPLQINLATDFRRSLTIPTRNGSKNIRTWAGNDTIHRALSDPDCKIDGGLGVNTVVYPGKRADWVIARVGSTFTVRPAQGGGGTDTLTRVQKAQFDDLAVELSSVP
ncbi:hypothetical protein FN976_20140 [Caenimonas sedimenti]|uniref:VCBS repeat-containing protein n=1 Tax=Caenimonas sedimenti TaxID=2596921 RepID=A0A562ZKV6_9BURK|nr:hypothetical protein [Caenimonas sedimenti]TWO69051.1 hypothetical protein FN976_20140 [Caenimonas sedimenti]